MATVPQRLGEDRATVPRIVLPITSRGLVLDDRLCWAILGAAMAVAAGLILYLNRGTTFNADELDWVLASPDLSARDVLEPYNGHLIATVRLVYKAILETVGAGYLPFRLLGAGAVLLAAAAFYAVAKRRIGAVPALAPTVVLLFFGSAGGYVATPIGFPALLSIAAGLGALLALERDDSPGDVAACGLVALSVATLSIGLAFAVGVGISVLQRDDRWRRAWIFLVPIALYGVWWLWALDSPGSTEGETKLSNALLIPNYVADSLAAAAGALAGLDYDFTDPLPERLDLGWGRVLAAVAFVALALRIKRGNVPRSLWVSLGIVLTVWAVGALTFAEEGRLPDSSRYSYMGAVGVLLVATDAARGVRFSKLGLAVLFAACAASLATNLALLRDQAATFRADSIAVRAQLAVLELARGQVDPAFTGLEALSVFRDVAPAGPYLEVVDRYGSPGFSLGELEDQTEPVRQDADQVLASALELRLEPSADSRPSGCRKFRSQGPGGPVVFELPPGGASLRVGGADSASLTVGRFAAFPSVALGSLSPRETATLRIPRDSSSTPWIGVLTGARSAEVCRSR